MIIKPNINEVIEWTSHLPAFQFRHNSFSHTSSGSWVDVTFSSALFDPWGIHDTTNTERFNLRPRGRTLWMLSAYVVFNNNATGDRGIRVVNNGGTTLATQYVPVGASGDSELTCEAIHRMETDTYVKVQLFQSTGGNLTGNSLRVQARCLGGV